MLEAMIKKKGEAPSWDSGPLGLLEGGGQVEKRVGAGATGMVCDNSQLFWLLGRPRVARQASL